MNKKKLITDSIASLKGIKTVTLDVRTKSSEMETIIIATGRSKTHINSIATKTQNNIKNSGFYVLPIEGAGSEWLIVDSGDIIVHIMSEASRDFYQLEKLWDSPKQ